VLWTRLMPDASRERDWQHEAVPVEWQIASDESMSRIVKRGRELAQPDYRHSIHVEVNGLEPGRWYWYRSTRGASGLELRTTSWYEGRTKHLSNIMCLLMRQNQNGDRVLRCGML
jgi:phosphodiesterase/alkaline phosphatase D-like protein